MKIGFIGAGAVSQAIALKALEAGHEVVLSSRGGAASLTEKVRVLGAGASAASITEAARQEFVVLAVPWNAVEELLGRLSNWDGRVLIDATNPFSQTHPKHVLANLGEMGASEIVAQLVPGARLVKAFNSIVMTRFAEGPSTYRGRRVIFLSGDELESKAAVKGLIESFGFAAIDLGGLVAGGRMQQAGGPLAGLDLVLV